MRRCPTCGKDNFDANSTCSCGQPLDAAPALRPVAQDPAPSAAKAQQRQHAMNQIGIGAAFLVIGVIITAVTYGGASQGGGTYIVAYGPIIFGAIRMIRGFASL